VFFCVCLRVCDRRDANGAVASRPPGVVVVSDAAGGEIRQRVVRLLFQLLLSTSIVIHFVVSDSCWCVDMKSLELHGFDRCLDCIHLSIWYFLKKSKLSSPTTYQPINVYRCQKSFNSISCRLASSVLLPNLGWVLHPVWHVLPTNGAHPILSLCCCCLLFNFNCKILGMTSLFTQC
jgi:hypothetical protein